MLLWFMVYGWLAWIWRLLFTVQVAVYTSLFQEELGAIGQKKNALDWKDGNN